MLPKVPEPPISGKHTIFVNPNFKRGMTQFVNTRDRERSQAVVPQNFSVKPHVNPLFLHKSVVSSARKPIPPPTPSAPAPKPTIHMNPKFFMNPMFLQNNLLEPSHYQHQHQQYERQHPSTVSQTANDAEEARTAKPMYKSSKNVSKKENLNMKANFELSASPTSAPLLHLSRTKLVRKPAETGKTNLSVVKPIALPHADFKANTKLDILNPKKRYKIDRTKSAQNSVGMPMNEKKKYLHKTKSSVSTRTLTGSRKNLKVINHSKLNKKLKLVRINNILYKTTRNKLLRKDLEKTKSLMTVMSKTKEELSILQNSVSKMNARNHISNAKSRSMQQLRKRFVKTNEPCIVFQRLGKCAAFQKGRCNKKHDKEQVVICPKYLRGECYDSDCLLSHNVCLAKMPVCKFYLQANCFRENCPYLHKKLSQHAEICTDFVRGYCKLAEKCNKRHEFMCPDLALKKKCVQPSCSFCKPKKQFKLVASKAKEKNLIKSDILIDRILSLRTKAKSKLTDTKGTETVQVMQEKEDKDDTCSTTRYFDTPQTKTKSNDSKNCDPALSQTDSSGIEETSSTHATVGPSILRKRPKLGFLPAFIPLS